MARKTYCACSNDFKQYQEVLANWKVSDNDTKAIQDEIEQSGQLLQGHHSQVELLRNLKYQYNFITGKQFNQIENWINLITSEYNNIDENDKTTGAVF